MNKRSVNPIVTGCNRVPPFAFRCSLLHSCFLYLPFHEASSCKTNVLRHYWYELYSGTLLQKNRKLFPFVWARSFMKSVWRSEKTRPRLILLESRTCFTLLDTPTPITQTNNLSTGKNDFENNLGYYLDKELWFLDQPILRCLFVALSQ